MLGQRLAELRVEQRLAELPVESNTNYGREVGQLDFELVDCLEESVPRERLLENNVKIVEGECGQTNFELSDFLDTSVLNRAIPSGALKSEKLLFVLIDSLKKLESKVHCIDTTMDQTMQKVNLLSEDMSDLFLQVRNIQVQEGVGGPQACVATPSDTHESRVLDTPVQPSFVTIGKLLHRTDLDHSSRGYQLQESVWDSAALLGFPCIGWHDTLLLFAGLIFNVVVQLCFCLVVYANMTRKTLDDDTVAAALHWRGVVGHDLTYADPVSQTTLVSRLCGKDEGLQFSAAQFDLNENVQNFLDPERAGILGDLNGRVLAAISLIIWSWAVLADVKHTVNSWVSVFSLPRGTAVIVTDIDGMRIAGIKLVQIFTFLLFSSLPRISIAFFLGYVGIRFLAEWTRNLNDLLLNGLALTFVLDLDEVIFEILVPHQVRSLIQKLQPLSIPPFRFPFLRAGHCQVLAQIILTCAITIFLNYFVLESGEETMREVTEAFCGGDQNFVVTRNKASGVVLYTESTPFAHEYALTYSKSAVLGHAFRNSDSMRGVAEEISLHLPDWESIWSYFSDDMQRSAANLQCVNILPFGPNMDYFYADKAQDMFSATKAMLRSWTGNQSLSACHDANVADCIEFTQNPLRAACPTFCGCESPWKGLLFGTANHGCPGKCRSFYEYFLKRIPTAFNSYISQTTCEDIPTLILWQDQGFQNYLAGVLNAVKINGGSKQDQDSILSTFAARGCNGIGTIAKTIDLCNLNLLGHGRSIRPWCPATCKCSAWNFEECPCPLREGITHRFVSQGAIIDHMVSDHNYTGETNDETGKAMGGNGEKGQEEEKNQGQVAGHGSEKGGAAPIDNKQSGNLTGDGISKEGGEGGEGSMKGSQQNTNAETPTGNIETNHEGQVVQEGHGSEKGGGSTESGEAPVDNKQSGSLTGDGISKEGGEGGEGSMKGSQQNTNAETQKGNGGASGSGKT